jgi:hypothetical protein
MTESVEPLAPASPGRGPKEIFGTKFNLTMAGIFFALCAFFVLFDAVQGRKNASIIWPLTTLDCALAILLPGAASFATYRQMKKAILASYTSPAVIKECQYWGARAILTAYMALMMVLGATLLR